MVGPVEWSVRLILTAYVRAGETPPGGPRSEGRARLRLGTRTDAVPPSVTRPDPPAER